MKAFGEFGVRGGKHLWYFLVLSLVYLLTLPYSLCVTYVYLIKKHKNKEN